MPRSRKLNSFSNCGIYILLRNDKVVYIGQSIAIDKRIRDHTKDKDFDSFQVLPIKDARMVADIETYLINTIKPEYNIKSPKIKSTELVSTAPVAIKSELTRMEKLKGVVHGMPRVSQLTDFPISIVSNAVKTRELSAIRKPIGRGRGQGYLFRIVDIHKWERAISSATHLPGVTA